MAIDTSALTLPKPIPRKRLKAQKDRREAAIKKATRAQCVERDGYCWAANNMAFQEAWCKGPSEWMHLPPRERWQTRGMAPEYRHDIRFTAMGCKFHHDRVDGRIGPSLVIKTPLEG